METRMIRARPSHREFSRKNGTRNGTGHFSKTERELDFKLARGRVRIFRNIRQNVYPRSRPSINRLVRRARDEQ